MSKQKQTMVQRTINLPMDLDDEISRLSRILKQSRNEIVTYLLNSALGYPSATYPPNYFLREDDSIPHREVNHFQTISPQALREASLIQKLKDEFPAKVEAAKKIDQKFCIVYSFIAAKQWFRNKPSWEESNRSDLKIIEQLRKYHQEAGREFLLYRDHRLEDGNYMWHLTISITNA